MGSADQTRGTGIVLPGWWLKLAARAAADSGMSQTELGRRLAESVKRLTPWNHSRVSQFLANDGATQEMAEAFSVLLHLPRVFYVPRSAEESQAMQAASARFDGERSDFGRVTVQRVAILDNQLEALEDAASRQTRAVESTDENGPASPRRPGRMARRRSPATGD